MADTDVSTIEDASGEDDFLSISAAAHEYAVKPSAIRQAVREGTIQSISHQWGTRVRRIDVARFAEIIASRSLRPINASAPRQRAQRQVQPASIAEDELDQLDYNVLAIVGEIGPATLAQIYDALRASVDPSFSRLVYSMRRLTAHHLVKRRNGNKGYIYELVAINHNGEG